MTKDKNLIEETTATFETEGRLLQELGERLVSSADVALVELIKNAYDADATYCRVSRSDDAVSVVDDGHGITQVEFLQKWMRIATGEKQLDKFSRNYKRIMTGAKGIGRFAVRFLGKRLKLESVAIDPTRSFKTRLIADFDWEGIDAQSDLRNAKIPYRIMRAEDDAIQGTTLTVSRLRDTDKIDFGKALRNQVLRIVSPISGLDCDRFSRVRNTSFDPGFALELPVNEKDAKDLNLAKALLDHCYTRVVINLTGSKLKYTITHKDGRALFKRTFNYPCHISKGLHADIRYFPRRAGMFRDVAVGGWVAWNWVHENCGLGVVDHGFRIRPYGFGDDDWLHLQIDVSRNKRDWRSTLMNRHYPISAPLQQISKEKANPMLYLPNFYQLVGAVFVESNQAPGNERPTDLTPAINRQGYIDNEAYQELVEVIRTGMELLAFVDHAENRRLEQEKAKKDTEALRSDFRAAIGYIQELPSLTDDDKARITTEYSSLSKHLEKVEDYYHDASQRMDTMSLLGVMAGFMTHEARALIAQLDSVVKHLQRIASSDQSVARVLPEIKRSLETFRGQIEYSALFIDSIQNRAVKPGRIPVTAQIELVTERFSKFAADRNVIIEIDADQKLQGPALSAAVYSGILLNLYTNALKAVVGGELTNPQRRVVFKAWNEPKWHFVEIADNGIGIPPNLRKRIWDPLFTTTSGGSGNPLGSGMGLGLTLVKEIVTKLGGRIDLVDPPPSFSTCFKVQLPNT